MPYEARRRSWAAAAFYQHSAKNLGVQLAEATIAASAGFAHGGVTGGLESLAPAAVVAGYTTPLAQTIRATGKSAVARALSRADIGDYGRLAQRAIGGDVSQYPTQP
jgi:hypothetical protein